MEINAKMKEAISRLEELKAKGELDISKDEDVSLAVMNLIGAEEHLFFTAEKTGKPEYLELLNEVREERKKMMKLLLPKTEGETWCMSKHLLSASMRMMEVATKLQTEGRKDEAKDMFDGAYKVYSMFWAVRLEILQGSDLKCELNTINNNEKPWTTEDIVGRLVDCCKE